MEPKWILDSPLPNDVDFPLAFPGKVTMTIESELTPAMVDALINAGMAERLISTDVHGSVKEEVVGIDPVWPNIILGTSAQTEGLEDLAQR
jgi:hypothetical protein